MPCSTVYHELEASNVSFNDTEIHFDTYYDSFVLLQNNDQPVTYFKRERYYFFVVFVGVYLEFLVRCKYLPLERDLLLLA